MKNHILKSKKWNLLAEEHPRKSCAIREMGDSPAQNEEIISRIIIN